jgi:hypothetical protein
MNLVEELPWKISYKIYFTILACEVVGLNLHIIPKLDARESMFPKLFPIVIFFSYDGISFYLDYFNDG